MVETIERIILHSRVENRSIEMRNGVPVSFVEKDSNNGSITNFILNQKGIDNLAHNFLIDKKDRIPTNVLRELVLIDNIDADESTKKKMLTFRLWAQEGKYDLVTEYLPEGTIGLEEIQAKMPDEKHKDDFMHLKRLEDIVDEIIKGEEKMGDSYHLIHTASDIADDLLSLGTGPTYMRKYELMTRIAIEKLRGIEPEFASEDEISAIKEEVFNVFEVEVIGIENRTRIELNREKKNQKDYSQLIHLRNNHRLPRKEIAKKMKKSLKWVKNSINHLYLVGRIGSSRPFNRDREVLEQDVLQFSTRFLVEHPGKRLSVTRLEEELSADFSTIKEIFLNLEKKGYTLPRLETSRSPVDKKTIEDKILESIEGKSLEDPINLTEIYENGNFECSKVTFYNIYHDLGLRMPLPPFRHGGKWKKK